MVPDSNGDSILGLDSTEIWSAEMDTDTGSPASPSLEEKAGTGAVVCGEDIGMTEETQAEDPLDEPTMEEKHNCERLSPQNQLDGSEADGSVLETIFIPPLDGNQAELRTRIIKEVRKPGRSKYQSHIMFILPR